MDVTELNNIDAYPLEQENIGSRMREDEHLPFERLNWKTFEVLCAKLARSIYGEAIEYNAQGQNQEGIDIWVYKTKGPEQEFTGSNDSKVYIQCKKNDEVSGTLLKSVVNRFKQGIFHENGATLILCLSKGINTISKLHNTYIEAKLELAKEGITFIIWDAGNLEELLKVRPQIVYDIFDRDESANWTIGFCGKQLANLIVKKFIPFPNAILPSAVQNYIKRKVFYLRDVAGVDKYYNRVYTDLLTIVKEGKHTKIALLSIAGGGKSSEVKQIEHLIIKENTGLYPIHVSLNNYTAEPFEDYVSQYEPNFKFYDPSKMVLLLDGYDEIPSDKIYEAAQKLNSFCNSKGRYRYLRVIVTSRNNFYRGQFQDFSTYYLDDISKESQSEYIHQVLSARSLQFNSIIQERQIEYLLTNAYNLVQLVRIFQKDGSNQFPKTKAKAFDRIIRFKLEEDFERIKVTKPQLIDNKETILLAATKLAFAMEQLGRNQVDQQSFNRIIKDEKVRHLLTSTFLVNKGIAENYSWQFEHNNFQEYLAAKVLAKMDTQSIKEVIAFAPDFSKVKPRWANTICLLFSLLDPSDFIRIELIKWITSIEPEIVVKFEKQVMPKIDRIQILTSILDSYKNKDILFFSESLHREELAIFGSDLKEFVEYLLNEIKNPISDSSLSNAIINLTHFGTLYGLEQEISINIRNVLKSLNWSKHTIRNSIECLLAHSDNKESTLQFVIENCLHLSDFTVRDLILYEVKTLANASNFIDFILESVLIHAADRKRNEISYEPYNLVSCIHACRTPDSVIKILQFVVQYYKEHFGHDSHYRGFETKLFSDVLIDTLVAVYSSNKKVYDILVSLVKLADDNHDHKLSSKLRCFFTRTGTSLLAFEELLPSYFQKDRHWHFVTVLDDVTLPHVVDGYSSGRFDADFIWRTLFSLRWEGATELHDKLQTQINLLTQDAFVYKKQISQEEANALCHANDLKLLLNPSDFLAEAQMIFTSFELRKLALEDLCCWERGKFSEENLSHSIVLDLLQDMARDRTFITIRDVSKFTKDKRRWEWFVIQHLRTMLDKNIGIDLANEQVILNWCYSKLSQCNFKTAVWKNEKNGCSYRNIEFTIATFWMSLNFEVEESLLLDFLYFDFHGIKIYREAGKSPDKTLSDYVAERIKDIPALKRRVIHILDEDVYVNVKASLVRKCRDLHIVEATAPIFKIIESEVLSDYEIAEALSIYVELGGDKDSLVSLLNTLDLTKHWHWQLIELLSADYYEAVHKCVKNCGEVITDSHPYHLTVLIFLLNSGHIDSWKAFTKWMIKNNQVDFHLSKTISLSKLPTDSVLSDLISLLVASFSKDFRKRFASDEYSDQVMNLIFDFALSSEDRFQKIMQAFNDVIENRKSEHPNVSTLHYTQRRLERTFYINKGDSISLEEALKKNEQIFTSLTLKIIEPVV